MTYVIALPCVDLKDKACIEECPVDCIYEGERMLYIHPDECVDCGACEPVCPVEAIYYEDDVPAEWTDYTAANAEFFNELGLPRRRGQARPDRQRRAAGQGPPAAGARPLRTLPDFPWDRLTPFKERAAAHPGGIVDLSIGTPVDPTPPVIADALAAAADSPGYPLTTGAPATRDALVAWVTRRLGAPAGTDVLPTIGTKEFVAWLPTLLGLGPADRVVIPELAYPTYDVGARLAGAQVLVADSLTAIGPARVSLLWLNSPSNPTGKVLPVDHMAKVVSWARERGVLVVSDECYYELGWTEQPVSVLHPDVCGGDPTGVIALHSLSKRSNLAGYRFGFAAGDPAVIAALLEVRKHAGMMVPGPVQAAAIAALGDDAHVVAQRAVYRARREVLIAALTAGRLPDRRVRRRPLPVGHPRASRAGTPWPGWPTGGSSSPPASSTAAPAPSTSESPSPPPTNAWPPPPSASPPEPVRDLRPRRPSLTPRRTSRSRARTAPPSARPSESRGSAGGDRAIALGSRRTRRLDPDAIRGGACGGRRAAGAARGDLHPRTSSGG